MLYVCIHTCIFAHVNAQICMYDTCKRLHEISTKFSQQRAFSRARIVYAYVCMGIAKYSQQRAFSRTRGKVTKFLNKARSGTHRKSLKNSSTRRVLNARRLYRRARARASSFTNSLNARAGASVKLREFLKRARAREIFRYLNI